MLNSLNGEEPISVCGRNKLQVLSKDILQLVSVYFV